MDKQQILHNFIEGMGASQNKHYIKMVQSFLKFATALDRDNVVRYTEHLREEGYAAGSIELFQRTIRSCFKRNGVAWPLKRGENATIPADEELVLALTPETVETMIQGALSGKVDILYTWFLALSTTYGLRRREIAEVGPHRIDLTNRHVYIETLKGGRARYHYIPDEILPIAKQVVPYLHKISPRYVTEAFQLIEAACGIEHIPETGWHSIRHSLLYFLIENGVSIPSAAEFMRWGTGRERSSMPIRYHDAQFVGLGVKGGTDIGASKVQDIAIFEKHPFLQYWRAK